MSCGIRTPLTVTLASVTGVPLGPLRQTRNHCHCGPMAPVIYRGPLAVGVGVGGVGGNGDFVGGAAGGSVTPDPSRQPAINRSAKHRNARGHVPLRRFTGVMDSIHSLRVIWQRETLERTT